MESSNYKIVFINNYWITKIIPAILRDLVYMIYL